MPRFTCLIPLLAALAVSGVTGFTDTECVMRPDNDEDNVIEDAKSVTLECSFDEPVASCTWMHNEPINERSNDNTWDFVCTGIPDQSDTYCNDDTSINTMFSESSCGLSIGNAKPEHTGRWYMNAVAVGSPSVVSPQTADYTFTLYTYNQSTVYLVDEEERDVDNDNIDTSYNYNDRNDDWEDDKTGWESLEFKALAYGGRPEPIFHWYVDNRGNDLQEEYGDVFRVSTGVTGCEDNLGFICNEQSTITFGVDDRLMEVLDELGVDTNPEDEWVRFELNCDVEQEGIAFVQTMRVDINVEKSYDNGALPASTIGIIVAVVIAVIILLIVVCILLMAKRSHRWCFADEDDRRDYAYRSSKDPRDPRTGTGSRSKGGSSSGASKSRYNNAGYRSSSGERGASRHHSSQQVHSTTIDDRTVGIGAGAAVSSTAPLIKKQASSSTATSSSSVTPDIKKQQWTLPPKELRESLNKLNEERKFTQSGNLTSSTASTPDTPRKKRKPPATAPSADQEKRQPLFIKNSKYNNSSSSSHSPNTTTTTSNNHPTGATPKVHRGVWQSSPPYPQYQTTTSTSSSSAASPTTPKFNNNQVPSLPKKPGNASASNRESVNYADLDLATGNRRSFMQDPRNQVLPAFAVVPRQSPPSSAGLPPERPPKYTGNTTTTVLEERTEYASVVQTSSYV